MSSLVLGLHRRRWIIGLVAVLAVTLSAMTVVGTASADAAAAVKLRIVTANVNYNNSPKQVKQDIKRYAPKADVILFQEAKNVKLRNMFNLDKWAVVHDTSTKAKAGSAVVFRKSVMSNVGSKFYDIGTRPHGQDILTRWITSVNVKLTNGSQLRLTSLHMPPKVNPGLQDNMAGNVVDFAKGVKRPVFMGGDWNLNVNNDPKNIGGRTGLSPHGKGIDGFYVPSDVVAVESVKKLAKGNSDHHPIHLVAQVG